MKNKSKQTTDNKPLSATVTIANKRGLHARASARFVKLAEKFDAKVTVLKDKQEVLGTSIMGLLLLAAAKGEQITITTMGADSAIALKSLQNLVENKFEEDN